MQKIGFNNRLGLQDAVLEGRKTMTRRIAEKVLVEDENGYLHWNGEFKPSRYKVGEVVAVAQSYHAIHDEMMCGSFGEGYGDGIYDAFRNATVADEAGWDNKMFVKAELMPHRIRITNVSVKRLQDISDEDCLREGIRKVSPLQSLICLNASTYQIDGAGCENTHYTSPRGAFAALIDKVSCKGTWGSNPWVWVYEFELVK